MHFKKILDLIKKSVKAWVDDYAPSMGAALAYYTLFSIAPLLIIAIAVAGLVFGDEAARGEIIGQIQGLIGKEGAIAVQGMLKNANEPAKSMLALAGSGITMIIGATTVFGELQSDLDRIWRVSLAPQKGGLWNLVRTRLLSFGFVLGVGFLLLISLVMSAAVAGLGKWVGSLYSGWEVVLHLLDVSISFAITTLLFALMYKFMPRAKVAWRDVWIGAAVTAFLFVIGKFLLGLYLGKASVASGFGAAGSLVILLLWVYYGAQIFLLGAEFTWAYSNTYGSKALTDLSEKNTQESGSVPSRDSQPDPTTERESFSDLLGELAKNSAAVVRDEIQLVIQRIREKVKAALIGVLLIVTGAAIGFAGFICLCAALIIVLTSYMSPAIASLVTGTVFALISVVIAFIGSGKLKT